MPLSTDATLIVRFSAIVKSATYADFVGEDIDAETRRRPLTKSAGHVVSWLSRLSLNKKRKNRPSYIQPSISLCKLDAFCLLVKLKLLLMKLYEI